VNSAITKTRRKNSLQIDPTSTNRLRREERPMLCHGFSRFRPFAI
jgi:hypothetical protein